MKRNTRVETNNVLCLGWVMASLVFIILLFIMYILYACIFFLYSKSVYQMTMSFITNDSRSGGKICSGDDSLAVESMATQVLCLILFHRWGSSEMLQNYQLLLLTFVGNANTHPKGEKKITRLGWALGRLPSSDYLTGYWPPYGWASFG